MSRRLLLAIGDMSGGGSQRQMLGIMQRLDRDRFQPELYVVSSAGELLGEVPHDVPVHCFEERWQQPSGRLPGSAFRDRCRDLAALLDERGIDVIYDRTYHMTLIAAAAARWRPTPRVSVIVADPRLDFETNPERFRRTKRRLLRRAYREADLVLAVSDGVRTAAADYHRLPPAQIETSYNFFDVEQIERAAREPLPEPLRRTGEKFRIVAAGRLHRQKGFDLLIEAVRLSGRRKSDRPIELLILGTGDLKDPLEQQIKAAGLEQQVTLAGFQQNPLPIYRSADLFCLSSRYEGMPNALVEAMLCGAPVIAADCPSGPAEILEGGELGRLVPVDDAASLARAIRDSAKRHSARQERAARARDRIADRFSPQAGIERTMHFIERACDRFRDRQ